MLAAMGQNPHWEAYKPPGGLKTQDRKREGNKAEMGWGLPESIWSVSFLGRRCATQTYLPCSFLGELPVARPICASLSSRRGGSSAPFLNRAQKTRTTEAGPAHPPAPWPLPAAQRCRETICCNQIVLFPFRLGSVTFACLF